MIYIIAGHYLQAREYARENNLTMKDYRIVTSAEYLKGIENPHIVLVGTYERRPDIKELLALVNAMRR